MKSCTPLVMALLLAAALATTGCKDNGTTTSGGGGSSGSVDTNFGGGDGTVVTTVSSTTDDLFNGVTTDSSDRIIAVGRSAGSGNGDILAIRYLADGSIDTTFGSAGIALVDIANTADEAYDVAIDGSGNVVVVGKTHNGTNDDWVVVRLTSAGALDTTFNSTGFRTIDFGSGNDWATGVAILASGNIVVTGVSRQTTDDFTVVVLTSAGAFDTSFDTDGQATYDLASGDQDQSFDVVAVGNDFVLGGFARVGGGGNNFALLRIDNTGARVTSFGSNGQAITDFPNGGTDEGYALATTSTHVYLAGTTDDGGRNKMGITRHQLSDGAIDTTWGTNGKVIIDFDAGATNQQAEGIAVQGDGKVVVAGTIEITAGNDDVAIARMNTDGTLDTSFDTDGLQVTAPNGTENDRGHAVAAHQGTGFVVAGETHLTSPGQFDPLLIRYNQ